MSGDRSRFLLEAQESCLRDLVVAFPYIEFLFQILDLVSKLRILLLQVISTSLYDSQRSSREIEPFGGVLIPHIRPIVDWLKPLAAILRNRNESKSLEDYLICRRVTFVHRSHAIVSSTSMPFCVNRARPAPSVPMCSNSQSASGIVPQGIFLSTNSGATAFDTGVQPSTPESRRINFKMCFSPSVSLCGLLMWSSVMLHYLDASVDPSPPACTAIRV